MDARVSRNRGWYAPRLDWMEPPGRAQARAERRALAAVVAKPGDRLLRDAALSREEAEELLATGSVRRALIAGFAGWWRR